VADGAFTVAGPAAWNALPPQLRNATSRTRFLSRLKMYLYNNHFNNIISFKVFVISVVLPMYSSFYRIFKFHFITVRVLY